MTTVSDIRFSISTKFREIESLVDLLQNELAGVTKKLSELEKAKEEKKDKK